MSQEMAMSGVSDAKPRDVYVDQDGNLWRVVCRWDQPVVQMEAIDLEDERGRKARQIAGINGQLWDGFKRIHRDKDARDE